MVVMGVRRLGYGSDPFGCQIRGQAAIDHDCVGIEKGLRSHRGKGIAGHVACEPRSSKGTRSCRDGVRG